MDQDKFKSFKYMLGELTYKKKFEGLQTVIETVEGNVITSNYKFVAVSNTFFMSKYLLVPMERTRRWSCCRA
jgi:hypothetical protein